MVLFFHGFAISSLFVGPSIKSLLNLQSFDSVLFCVVLGHYFAVICVVFFVNNLMPNLNYRYNTKELTLTLSILGIIFACFNQSTISAQLALIPVFLGMSFALRHAIIGHKGDDKFQPYFFGLFAICSGVITFLMHYFGLVENYNTRYIILIGAGLEVILTGVMVYDILNSKVEGFKFLQYSLSGMISESEIEKMAEEGRSLSLYPNKVNVSILITDIKEYSKIIHEYPDNRTFLERLREYYGLLFNIIHQHNGVINKTVGDSIVCYFGYSLTGEVDPNHPQKAVSCALQIQRALVHQYVNDGLEFPTRIGIHTGEPQFGNVNPVGGIDFTLTGDAVNLAKRYEDACEPFLVVISKELKSKLKDADEKFSEKFITIKHSMTLEHCWEVNPFIGVDSKQYNYEQAIEKLENKGKEHREYIFVPDEDMIFEAMEPIRGQLKICNYSLNGIALISDINIGRGVKIHGHVGSQKIVAEIKRTEKFKGKYKLGARISNLTEKEKNQLFGVWNLSAKKSNLKIVV